MTPPLFRGQLNCAREVLFYPWPNSEFFSQLIKLERFFCWFQPSLTTSPQRRQDILTRFLTSRISTSFLVQIHQEAHPTTIIKYTDASNTTPHSSKI